MSLPPSNSGPSSSWKPPHGLVEQLQRHEAELTQKYGPLNIPSKFNPPAFMVRQSRKHAGSLGLTEEVLQQKAQEEEECLRVNLYTVEKNVPADENLDNGVLPGPNPGASEMEHAMPAPEAESSPGRAIPWMNSSVSPSELLKLRDTPKTVSSSLSVLVAEDDFQVLPMPQWYNDIKPTNFTMKETMKRKKGQTFTALDALKACIRKFTEQKTSDKDCNELRNHLYKAELKLEVNKYIIKGTRILNPDVGLPRIFSAESKPLFPDDIRIDSYHLYLRWMNEDFSQDILRGIVTVKGRDRNGDRLDAEYRKRHPYSPKFFGQAMTGLTCLVIGQWWPTQLCAVRDGAHGSSQGGIFGGSKGAYSIVLSSGGYGDRDEGDVIEYAGTDGKDFKPTDATLAMVQSCELQNPVRVLRSSQLPKANKYRPDCGLRYDGLYQVTGYVVVDEEKQIHRFRLERCPGQLPIRCKGSGAERPTIYEKEKFEELKRKKDW